MIKSEILNLISVNLADSSTITASEHREVEEALANNYVLNNELIDKVKAINAGVSYIVESEAYLSEIVNMVDGDLALTVEESDIYQYSVATSTWYFYNTLGATNKDYVDLSTAQLIDGAKTFNKVVKSNGEINDANDLITKEYYYDNMPEVDLSNYVTLNEIENITGKKTFTVELPESTLVPSEDADLINKKYADDNFALKSNVLQLDNTTAFTPDSDYEPAPKKYVDDKRYSRIQNPAGNMYMDIDNTNQEAIIQSNPIAGADVLSVRKNGVEKFAIKDSGLAYLNTTNYETLVLANNDIPNKKYVDNGLNLKLDKILTEDNMFIGDINDLPIEIPTTKVLSGIGTFISGVCSITDNDITNSSIFTTGLKTCSGVFIRGVFNSTPNRITFTSYTIAGAIDTADNGTFGYIINV